jgi:hypothetical protein
VTDLTIKTDGQGHKLYVDNFFSPPDLFDSLTKKIINCCGNVRTNRKSMPRDLGEKNPKLKPDDI